MYNVKRGREATELAMMMITKVNKKEGRIIINCAPTMFEVIVICEIDNKYMLNYCNSISNECVVSLLRKGEVDAILKPFTNEGFKKTVNKDFEFGGF